MPEKPTPLLDFDGDLEEIFSGIPKATSDPETEARLYSPNAVIGGVCCGKLGETVDTEGVWEKIQAALREDTELDERRGAAMKDTSVIVPAEDQAAERDKLTAL